MRKLTPEQVDELVAGYEAGATTYQLARHFQIHRVTVSEHLHRRGVKMRRAGLDVRQVERAVGLYEDGLSVARIGSQLDVDGGTVWRALRAQGIRMRNTSGRER